MKRIATAAAAVLLFALPSQAYMRRWPSLRYSDFCELQAGMTRSDIERALGALPGYYLDYPWEPAKWKQVELAHITWPPGNELKAGPGYWGDIWRMYPQNSFPRQIYVQWGQDGRAYAIHWRKYAPR
jgi:hypothetical protein